MRSCGLCRRVYHAHRKVQRCFAQWLYCKPCSTWVTFLFYFKSGTNVRMGVSLHARTTTRAPPRAYRSDTPCTPCTLRPALHRFIHASYTPPLTLTGVGVVSCYRPRMAAGCTRVRFVHCCRLLEGLRNSVVGERQTFITPYGRRRIVYVDYTASGRALAGVERYITRTVL